MSKSCSSQETIQVEYCRSCETHSWCTHHDEAKYHDTFVRFAELVALHFPALEVLGNLVPAHLIPFKIAENKYIDALTNKYVVYPTIGAFEVRFRGRTLFSKKQTHAWPHLPALLHQVAAMVQPVLPLPERSPQKMEKSPKKEEGERQGEGERKGGFREQPKGFTLTDHFKMYRPKNRPQEKDWLTEKHESEASYKQISEMGRADSREKTESSERRGEVGQSKLKEMLRTKGLQLREQGRKEMIIKLDSIEEENQCEEGAAATQRTQEIVKKSNKMKQFEDDMSSLESKFISFENRVQDIHKRNKEFQYREAGSDKKEKEGREGREGKGEKGEKEGKLQGKLERSSPSKKEELRGEKTNKLEQYLAFSEHEKNQKLHRIYGEWKLIKQFGTRNKKQLKKKGEEAESSEDDTSQAHSQSPSTANILAFRPKVDRSHPRPHPHPPKYSSIERYNQPLHPVSPTGSKIKTQDNFYSREEREHATRLIKKGLNASSMDALRSLANNQSQKGQEMEMSSSAKANLHKISSRISNIQEQLKKHKEWKEAYPAETRKLSRDHSEYSQNSNKLIRNYGNPLQRSSHQSGSKAKGQVSGEKKGSQFREGRLGESVIEEEFQPMESKLVSRHNKYERESEANGKGKDKDRDRREMVLSRKISEKKDRAFREKILPQRESRQPKEQLKLRQSKDTNPRFSKDTHPHPKKQPLSKSKEKSIDLEPPHPRLSELKPLEKKVSKQTLNKMRLSDSKETVIRPKKKDTPKEEKETPRKGQLQAEPEIHSEDEDSREQYPNGSEDEMQASRLSPGRRSQGQQSSPSKPDSFSRQDARKYGRIMKNKSPGRQNTQYDLESEQPTQGNCYQDAESDTVGNYSHARQAEALTETKMRKTLGYFKAEALCFRGARTSEGKNRSERVRQEGQNHMSEGVEEDGGSEREYLNEENEDEGYRGREEGNEENDEEYGNTAAEREAEQNGERDNDNGRDAQLNCRKMVSNDSESFEDRVSLDKDVNKNDKTTKEVEFDTVEGWKLNTEEEYEDNQFEEPEPEDAEPEGEAEAEGEEKQKSQRRNSLDKELQEDERREALTERQSKMSRESGRIVKVGRGSSQTERARKESDKLERSQPLPIQEQNEVVQQKRVVAGKPQLVENSPSNSKNSPAASENTPIIKQNSPNSKENSPTESQNKDETALERPSGEKTPQNITKPQTKQLSPTKFNLDSPAPATPDLQTKMVAYFMKTIEQAVCRQILIEDCGYDIPEEPISEPQCEEAHPEGKETASDPSLKDIADMGEDNKLSKAEEEKGNTQITPVATLELASHITPQETSPKGQNNPTPPLSADHPSPTKQPLSNLSNSPLRSPTKHPSKLADNVYSQSISASKFKQIGVQKELTLQVSIQTETPTDSLPINPHSAHVTHRPSQSPNRQEYDGTVRNNFLPLEGETVRAKIIEKIYSQNKEEQIAKFADFAKGDERYLVKETGDVGKLGSVYPGGQLLGERSLEVEAVSSKFGRLVKVLDILAEQSEWLLRRLFEDGKGTQRERGFGVWLCRDCRWECFILDDCVRISDGQPLFTRHASSQFWPHILEKALAIAVGGYDQLGRASSGRLFTLLTGCNALSLKVKEDPSKNGKLLQLVSQCLRKNYPIHAEKGWLGGENESDRRQPVYRLLAIRKAVADEEALLELSQDGRESFWLRLSKFTAEFGRVEVLQLRMGHNFAHVELGTPLHGQLSVVELEFLEEGQGCVTLSYIGCEGPLKAYLYRQEKSRLLKLVGQARERSKSHLFFECNFTEGRYFLFAQAQESPARLAYLGEGRPTLKITEEIHSEGLKNDVAEYLPVEQERRENETGSSWRRGPRLRDNFVESRLREEFVDYVMGRSKRQGG